MATGLAIEGSCRQNDSPAGCCQTNNANSVTWPPQSPEAVLLGGSLHEKVTGSRATAPAVDWMLIRSDTHGHVDVQGSRSLNQATNTPAGLAAGHLNLTIDAAKRVNLTWNSINRPTCRASLASYLRLAHETSPGQFIDTNQASNQAEGLIDVTVASYPGSIHKPCGKLMYRYKYQLQNVWPSDGAIIQEVSYYKSIVPCAKWGFLVKSNQEGASQIRLERLDHYYEAFPTIERGQREDNDVTKKEGYSDYVGEPEHPETCGAVVQIAFAKFFCYTDMMGVNPRKWPIGGMGGSFPNIRDEPAFWKKRAREQGSRTIVHIWACCEEPSQAYFFSNP
jgi:hypothetical protein